MSETEAMGNWLEGAITALVQIGADVHSFTVTGTASAVAIQLSDGRVITRRICDTTGPTKRTPGTPSKVYLIAASNGQIKIGIAQNIRKRIQGLQNAHGDPLSLLAEFEGGRELEQKLHKALAPHRLKGEWFQSGPWVDALLAAVAAGAKPAQLVRIARGARDA